jgi:hypothetical protein
MTTLICICVITATDRRQTVIEYHRDEWSGFADLLANLIEKYAAVLDIDNLPDPPVCLEDALKMLENDSKLLSEPIEKPDAE